MIRRSYACRSRVAAQTRHLPYTQIAAGLPTAAGPTATDESHNNTEGGAEGAQANGHVETAAEADDGGAISARSPRDLREIIPTWRVEILTFLIWQVRSSRSSRG